MSLDHYDFDMPPTPEVIAELRNVDWSEGGFVHNWRLYASEALRKVWGTFNDEQLWAVFGSLRQAASREEWD